MIQNGGKTPVEVIDLFLSCESPLFMSGPARAEYFRATSSPL